MLSDVALKLSVCVELCGCEAVSQCDVLDIVVVKLSL